MRNNKEEKSKGREGDIQDAEIVEAVVVEPQDDKPQAAEPNNNRFPLWVTMFAIVGVYLASLFIGAFVKFIIEKTANADAGFANFMAYMVQFSVTIIFAVWILIKRGTSKPIMRFSIKKANPTLILWGLILVFVTSVVIEPLLSLFPATNLDMLKQITTTGGWAMLTSVVAAPILEEMLFRGIVQEQVTREYGGLWGVLLTSVLFALAHVVVPQQAVNAFFIGLILGYIYIKTKSLVPVIIIHAINNAVSYIIMSLFNDNIVMTRSIIGNDVLYWIVYGLCAVIFVVSVVNLVAQIKKESAAKAA